MSRGHLNTDDGELLPLFIKKTVPDAIQTLVERFQKKMTEGTQERFTRRDYFMEFAAFSLAAASGLMYWNSSQEGGERWEKYLHTVVALYAAQLGGAVTNGLFNLVSYRRIFYALRTKRSEEEKMITQMKGEKTKWGASFFIALFALLPIWYESLGGALLKKILSNSSGLLNVPVNMLGAKLWFDQNQENMHRFFDRIRGKCCAMDLELKSKQEALREAKEVIVKRIRDQAKVYANLNVRYRERVFNEWMYEGGQPGNLLSWGQFLSKLLNTQVFEFLEGSILSDSSTLAEGKSWLQRSLRPVVWSAAVLAFFANFGYGVMSFYAGKSIIDSDIFGALSTSLHLIPSLAYTQEGVSIFSEFVLSGQSLEWREMPALYFFLAGASLLVASLSGVTADQMGYEGWKKWFYRLGGETAAIVSGVLHNFPTAWVYNWPQCLTAAKDVVHRCAKGDLKRDFIFIKGLNELADLLERMPISSCEKFLNSSMVPREDIRTFLSTIMSDEQLQKIDRFYGDQSISHGDTTGASSSASPCSDNYHTFN